MMWSCCREGGGEEDEEEDQYFDTREEISSVSDSGSDCLDDFNFGPSSGSFDYEIWIKNPDSVQERRRKFFNWLGVSIGHAESDEDSTTDIVVETSVNFDRVREDSGAVLANSDSKNSTCSTRSSISCWSSESQDSLEDRRDSGENAICLIRNLDDGTEFIVDELDQNGILARLREVGSNRLITAEQFHSAHGFSHLVHQFMQREVYEESSDLGKSVKRAKRSWLRRLGKAACAVDRQDGFDNLEPDDSTLNGAEAKDKKIRVHQSKKRSKELSALYMEQEIQAHKGSILTMKFSPDGQYLASAGEDGIVCVWQVMESERPDEVEVLDADPSAMYFTVNQSSQLAPLVADKGKKGKFKGLRKTSDATCVIFPPRVFRILDKPLHKFHGHSGEILDLSWSKNKYLLSSSVDKTVRLWKIGCERCLRVFAHNNFVTCVQFNPEDDDHFISGSIDGKVRIWNIPGCRVVDWTDIREIVTAVCYRPDGQGCIVGSMTGNCRFYDLFENNLQLEAQICLQSKKKTPGKRITGFQFSPIDPSKLMVTSADSQVRILDGVDIICKYRGLRNTNSQISASFTLDGKHIVSASEDSNVYIWNYKSQDGPAPSRAKSTWSSEHFFSTNVSVAIPWCGIRSGNSIVSTASETHSSPPDSEKSPANWSLNMWKHNHLNDNLLSPLPLSLPDSFPLGNGLFIEALPKGSATWPEEKLPVSSKLVMSPAMCKSQYKFLKSSCQSTFTCPHLWGVVIVTASWDGRIRSFHNYGLPILS